MDGCLLEGTFRTAQRISMFSIDIVHILEKHISYLVHLEKFNKGLWVDYTISYMCLSKNTSISKGCEVKSEFQAR